MSELLAAGLAAVFLVSTGSKVRDYKFFYDWFVQLPVVGRGALAKPAIVGEWVLYGIACATGRLGAGASLLFLGVATGFLVWSKQQGMGCGCFGKTERVTWRSLARNVLLMLIAGWLLVDPPATDVRTVVALSVLACSLMLTYFVVEEWRDGAFSV